MGRDYCDTTVVHRFIYVLTLIVIIFLLIFIDIFTKYKNVSKLFFYIPIMLEYFSLHLNKKLCEHSFSQVPIINNIKKCELVEIVGT